MKRWLHNKVKYILKRSPDIKITFPNANRLSFTVVSKFNFNICVTQFTDKSLRQMINTGSNNFANTCQCQVRRLCKKHQFPSKFLIVLWQTWQQWGTITLASSRSAPDNANLRFIDTYILLILFKPVH